jgi:hypothetical protein
MKARRKGRSERVTAGDPALVVRPEGGGHLHARTVNVDLRKAAALDHAEAPDPTEAHKVSAHRDGGNSAIVGDLVGLNLARGASHLHLCRKLTLPLFLTRRASNPWRVRLKCPDALIPCSTSPR